MLFEIVQRSIKSVHKLNDGWYLMLKEGQTVETTYDSSNDDSFYILHVFGQEVIAEKWIDSHAFTGYVQTSQKFAQALYMAGWPHVTR